MNKLTFRIVLSFSLIVFCHAFAAAQTRHSVWSDKPLIVRDGATGASFNTLLRGRAAFAWTQASTRAYASALGEVTAALRYEFNLVSVTSSTVDTINGRWVVRRNGVIVCNNCIGKAYSLNEVADGTKYFKIYVGTPVAYAEKWLYSGYLTNRFDF